MPDVGRLTGVIDAAGDSAGYRYDAAGNLVGIQRAAPGGPAITSFTPATGGIGAARSAARRVAAFFV